MLSWQLCRRGRKSSTVFVSVLAALVRMLPSCAVIIHQVVLSVFFCAADTDFYESFLMGSSEAA